MPRQYLRSYIVTVMDPAGRVQEFEGKGAEWALAVCEWFTANPGWDASCCKKGEGDA